MCAWFKGRAMEFRKAPGIAVRADGSVRATLAVDARCAAHSKEPQDETAYVTAPPPLLRLRLRLLLLRVLMLLLLRLPRYYHHYYYDY